MKNDIKEFCVIVLAIIVILASAGSTMYKPIRISSFESLIHNFESIRLKSLVNTGNKEFDANVRGAEFKKTMMQRLNAFVGI